MSAIVKTDAVVLKSMKYRETSKIVTFYTRQFGKLSTIVKGARQAKNKYGSSLEPMSYDSLVLYKKDGRELQTLAQCDLIKSFRHMYEDIAKMSVGMSIIELVTIVAHEEEENISFFTLLVDSLDNLNNATRNPSNLLYNFEIRLAKIFGFQLTFDQCISCRRSIFRQSSFPNEIQFHFSKGGPLCGTCSGVHGQTVALQPRVLHVLRQISESANFEKTLNIDIDQQSRDRIEDLLLRYLRFHVSGMRELKSEKVFSKILTIP